jgi:endonuclease YncB( thermonuclease family)
MDELEKITDCDQFTLDKEVHRAKVLSVYDGDTITVCFFYNNKYQKFHVRMHGYDSSEIKPKKNIPNREEIKKSAIAAKNRLIELIGGRIIYLYCGKFDKYGRLLGKIKLNENDSLYINDIMVQEGYGYPYLGKTKIKN